MKIREATIEDIPTFVEIGRHFHAVSRFKHYKFNAGRLAEKFKDVINSSKGTLCFFVAESSEGEAVGGLIGCIESHFFSELPIASVIHYDVMPEKRMGGAALRLLMAFKKWAENRNAVEINAGVNSGIDVDKMDTFLRKLGFELTGGNYSLNLANPSVKN